MNDRDFLSNIYYRLIKIHGENPNYDYMRKLRAIIEAVSPDKATNMRYFIFFYAFQTHTKMGNGSVWMKDDGNIPSNEDIKKHAAICNGHAFNASDVVVTGWKEMTEDDFKAFAKNS